MKTHNFHNISGSILNYKINTYNTIFNYIVLRKNKQGKYYIAYQLSNDIWSEHPFHKILKWPSKTQKKEIGGIRTFSSEKDAQVVMNQILKYSSNYPRRFVLSDNVYVYFCIFALFIISLIIYLI